MPFSTHYSAATFYCQLGVKSSQTIFNSGFLFHPRWAIVQSRTVSHSISYRQRTNPVPLGGDQPTDYVGQTRMISKAVRPAWWSLLEFNQRLLLLRIAYLHLYEATICIKLVGGLSGFIRRGLDSAPVTFANWPTNRWVAVSFVPINITPPFVAKPSAEHSWVVPDG